MATRNWNLECKVYVGNLGNSAAKNELEASFSKYGNLRNVWIARNPPGFAFVEFEDPRDAEDACRALDGTRMCGERVRVEMSSGKSRNRGGGSGGGMGGRGGGAPYRSRSPGRRSMSPRRRSRSRSPRASPVYGRYRRSGSRD
ncbi:RNA-binding protein 1-like isoform X2 [Pollicipes pollicipes]|uniref:RNA-binding protein 1-like isoform X2 n=1 Tax=Pollicipes pollicipes TaxID=41117 RepID=UPI00188515C3|nr:RNA-binding protein 1-like isoform X2 [Pollicipes pollicipes]